MALVAQDAIGDIHPTSITVGGAQIVASTGKLVVSGDDVVARINDAATTGTINAARIGTGFNATQLGGIA